MKLRMQALRPASGHSRAARVEPCHWSEGCWGVTAGKSSNNASNARGVTAGDMGRNSSHKNDCNSANSFFFYTYILYYMR